MAELRTILEGLKCHQVQTVLQSGNVVFQSTARSATRLAASITTAIEEQFSFAPAVLLLTAEALRQAVIDNPFPTDTVDGATLHYYFLDEPACEPDVSRLEQLAVGEERWHLHEQVFYLWAPDGIGRSKLAASVERCLQVTTTARNQKTVDRLLALLD
ncbi:MAG: DUF1697 domain-containing protein [Planctomycetaceae bacterium]|nr:DUF1697 domain-containing protein [Planctomycetaceae bacterium]